MNTEVSPEKWRNIFETAREFYQMAPWQWMHDSHLFGMVDPVSDQKCYGTVMGSMGNYYALALYRGKIGYKSYLLLQEEAQSDPEHALYEQDCLIASFEPSDDIDPQDLVLAHKVEVDMAGLDRLPGFRSYKKALMPWGPDEAELDLLEAGMRLSMEIAEAMAQNENYLVPAEADKGKLLFFTLKEGAWTSNWQKPDSLVEFSPPQMMAEKNWATEAQKLPIKEGTWLFERFFFRQPSLDDTVDRPYFPIVLMFLDMKTQVMRGLDIVHPFHLTDQGPDVLLELFQDAEMLPRQIVVSNKENYILLHALARTIGVEIHLEEDLDILPDIKAELYRQMEGQQG